MQFLCILILLSIPVRAWLQLPRVLKRAVAASGMVFAMSGGSPLLAAEVSPSTTAAVSLGAEASFAEFLTALDNGKIEKVVFVGIRPTSLIAYEKGGSGKPVFVRDGFPSYDDPLSPSGPTQAIAKVQHTPGVVCFQDISDVMALRKTKGAADVGSQLRPMLSHSAYPTEYRYVKDSTDGTYKVSGNDPRRGQ